MIFCGLMLPEGTSTLLKLTLVTAQRDDVFVWSD